MVPTRSAPVFDIDAAGAGLRQRVLGMAALEVIAIFGTVRDRGSTTAHDERRADTVRRLAGKSDGERDAVGPGGSVAALEEQIQWNE